MKTIRFTIPGQPQVLRRPRFARRGKHVTAYDPAKNVTAKESLAVQAASHAPATPHDGPVSLWVEFWFARPQSHFRAGDRQGSVKPQHADNRHTGHRADTSNLVKLVEDALTGIYWQDDCQIWELVAHKRYGDRPRTTITITLQ